MCVFIFTQPEPLRKRSIHGGYTPFDSCYVGQITSLLLLLRLLSFLPQPLYLPYLLLLDLHLLLL